VNKNMVSPYTTMPACLPACLPAGAIAMLETAGLAQDTLDVLQLQAARKGVHMRPPWAWLKPSEKQQLQMEEGQLVERGEEEHEEKISSGGSGSGSKQEQEAGVVGSGEAGGQLAAAQGAASLAAQAAGDVEAAAGEAAVQPAPQLQVGLCTVCCHWRARLRCTLPYMPPLVCCPADAINCCCACPAVDPTCRAPRPCWAG
jgi:hypothetical protein